MPLTKYKSANEAIAHLKAQGYKRRFKLERTGMRCLYNQVIYRPGDLYIVEIHRFTDFFKTNFHISIFVIECNDQTKGMIISTHTDCPDLQLVSFLNKVKVKSKNE